MFILKCGSTFSIKWLEFFSKNTQIEKEKQEKIWRLDECNAKEYFDLGLQKWAKQCTEVIKVINNDMKLLL